MELTKSNYLYCVTIAVIALLVSACGTKSEDTAEDSETASQSDTDSVQILLLGTDSVSAFELLLAEHEVDYRETSSGVFVQAIDSVANGGGHFWLYLVNGEPVPKASDKYLTSSGDTVTWVFRGGY